MAAGGLQDRDAHQTVSPFRVQYVPASVQLCIRDFCRSEGGGEDVLPIFQPLSAE